ncbi:MAG: hypothetical protein K2L98_02100, partial [Bacilli bacterium]|nr:hypothetical protein [Bacilli bacterium]
MNIKVKHAKNVPNISAKEALECMKKSLYLSIGMDVKTSIYLERMFDYKKYCRKTTRDAWTMAIYGVMMSVNDRDLSELEEMLKNYEKAGELLQRLTVEPIDEVALSYSQETSRNYSRDFVELLILIYSECGLEFDDATRKIENKENTKSGGEDKVKITQDTTVEEVNERTKATLYAMCGENTGMSKAEDVMDRFMEKLNNDEFPKVTEPMSREDFIPTEEAAEKIAEEYQEILDDIKTL